MNPRHIVLICLLAVPMLVLLSVGCSGQQSDNAEMAEQAPPASNPDDAGMTGSTAPEPPPPPPAQPSHSTSTQRPQRTQTIPEERPRPVAPQAPPPVSVTIPAGTTLAFNLAQPLSSENAMVGDAVSATLKSAIIVGDRVAFPAGSSVQGKVSDVKPATKGFKNTGGALSVQFNRITAPDGHSASITAGFSKLAEGSAGKKAGIIGGSAAGGALLGKILGKDAKGAAVIGGAIGTAVAGSTKGKEAIIQPDEDINIALERSAETTLKH